LFFRQVRQIEARKHHERHYEVDADDHDEREDGECDRRRGRPVRAVLELGRIEFACGGGALAEHLVVGDLVDPGRRPVAELLTGTPGGRLRAAEPPQAESEHDGGGDDAEPRRGERCGAEERHGAFWIAGVPGKADMVKVEVPSAIAAGIRRRGMAAARNSACAIGASTKNATNRLTPP